MKVNNKQHGIVSQTWKVALGVGRWEEGGGDSAGGLAHNSSQDIKVGSMHV